jgi:hypothetical protein
MNFKLDYKTQEAGSWGGDLNLSVAAKCNKSVMGCHHSFNVKNTLKFGVMKKGDGEDAKVKQFAFNGVETEVGYNNESKTFGAFLKFGAFANGNKGFEAK